MNLLRWISAAALAAGFSLAAGLLLPPRTGPDLAAVAAPACAVLGALLFLLPTALRGGYAAPGLALASALGGALAAASAAPFLPGSAGLIGIAASAGLMLYLLGTLGSLWAGAKGDVRGPLSWIALLAALLAASPVWLGPLIDLWQPDTPATNALIAANPLTHLAIPADLDWLRGSWLYRHSPLGSMRYDYPEPVWVIVGYLAACPVAAFAARRQARAGESRTRRAGDRHRPVLTQPHSAFQ